MIRAIFGDRPGIFLTCLFAWTLTNMDQALFGFAVPGMLAEFGLSLQAVGLILTISFAAAALLVIPVGIAADRFGRGTTLCVLLAVSICNPPCSRAISRPASNSTPCRWCGG